MVAEPEIRARKIMYELAKERGLLPQLIILCADARKKGKKIGKIPKEWTVNGLLGYLGREIEEKEEVRCPIVTEDE